MRPATSAHLLSGISRAQQAALVEMAAFEEDALQQF
jgi:hypothetical protein